jgi:hypothetical protein
MNECPKCKSEYKTGDTECQKCGIIFEKYAKHQIDRAKRNIETVKTTTKKEYEKKKKENPSCIVVVGGGFLLFCMLIVIYSVLFEDKKPAPRQQTSSTTSAPSENKKPAPRRQTASTTTEGAWYEGGTLHSASLTQWRAASHKNKLATAADWALSRPQIAKIVRDSGSIDTGRAFAIELMKCVDETSTIEGYDDMNTAEIAAMCMILMKW